MKNLLFIVVFFLVSFSVSYGLARLGKPDAIWLWHDILGVL